MGLVNHATKFSKRELAPDSPEMIAFIAVVKQAGCGISFVGWSKTSWMDPRGLRPLDHPPALAFSISVSSLLSSRAPVVAFVVTVFKPW
jgi:hypothetical protein